MFLFTIFVELPFMSKQTVMDSDLDSCLSYQPFKMLSCIIRKAMSRLVDTRSC